MIIFLAALLVTISYTQESVHCGCPVLNYFSVCMRRRMLGFYLQFKEVTMTQADDWL